MHTGYNPDLPELPDEGPKKGTRHILELYAEEIAEHASNIVEIRGLSAHGVERYKRNCFEAAALLAASAKILRSVHRTTTTA